ncbi:hypothetical protein Syn7803US112_48 [Synechococcus phage ACG-2014a]|uniref:Uncharacterized protein n=1 Tax=Synechococcus phage ACG-2014a TaxID=1493507 RepID=A0A0E3FF50_9CAUD|nr:hypothetical protein Syn7803US112_48 [Synechococcus phage ACG-2014a]
MQKTGLCSSGGKGSQGMTATGWQHTTNQTKPVGELVKTPCQMPQNLQYYKSQTNATDANHHQSPSTRAIPLQLDGKWIDR